MSLTDFGTSINHITKINMEDEVDLNNLEFHEKLGEGGGGTVSRVTFKKPFKGYTEAAAKSVWDLREEEVEIMRKLHHPNIVEWLAFYKNGPINVILLEYAKNGSLHNYLSDKTKPLPEHLMRKWLKESALAIKYLHGLNVLHRDIKAHNCILFKDNILKLCDFGLARTIDQSQATSTAEKGTHFYMAPEIFMGNKENRAVYSKPADIYSYGMLTLEITKRKPPWEDVHYPTVMFKVTSGERPPIPRTCPQAISDMIQRCWDDDPKKRPTIQDIVDDLNRSPPVNEETLPQTEEMGLLAAGIQDLSSRKNLTHSQQHHEESTHLTERRSYNNERIQPKHNRKPIEVCRVAYCDNGDMVVSGKGKGELYIIGGDGESKMKLTTHETDEEKQIGSVYGITVSLQGHILIVDRSKYVKLFTNIGEYLHCFSTLTPDENPNTKVDVRSITIDKTGHVLIGDRARGIITIHTCPDGTLVNKVKCSIGWRMAVNSKQQILYSFTEIRAIDYRGNKVFTIRPKIDEDMTGGKVVDVQGIVCDADDNIYIAMIVAVKQSDNKWHIIPNTGHLHMYSAEGKYQQCIASCIEYPRDVTITPDQSQLVVANQDSIPTYNVN